MCFYFILLIELSFNSIKSLPPMIYQEDGISAELGLAASEDAILDTLWERGEKEIVSGGLNEKNLIGHCAPFLSKLCRNFSLMQKVNASFICCPHLITCTCNNFILISWNVVYNFSF